MTLHPTLIRIPFLPDLTGPQRIERQRHFARLALEHCARLSGAPPGNWPMDAARVPQAREGFHWSIAHKPRFAAAIVSTRPVGIDVESLTPRGRDLSPAVASPEEWMLLADSQSREPNGRKQSQETRISWLLFFKMWTAKEATLKANKTGISGLKACQLTGFDKSGRLVMGFAGQSLIVDHLVYANHIAAVTAHEPVQWQVIESPHPGDP